MIKNMKFKEFVDWCNQRACDGCWGMITAMSCIEIIHEVRSKSFWRREKYWKDHYKQQVLSEIVNPINTKIEEMLGEVHT